MNSFCRAGYGDDGIPDAACRSGPVFLRSAKAINAWQESSAVFLECHGILLFGWIKNHRLRLSQSEVQQQDGEAFEPTFCGIYEVMGRTLFSRLLI
jgi:hypothetical protein